MLSEDRLTESIPSEREDQQTSLYTYEILTYPADYTLEVLVGHWEKLIVVPAEQRQFIWTQAQASKLIESFLMGLPVPPIYFFQYVNDSKLWVVDGLQRLQSIAYFFSGFFGEPKPNKKVPVFSLTGLNKKSPFKDRTYLWLQENDENAFNKLQNSVLRSFVMKQLQPKDNTSIFQVFERLNSGGMVLQGQEIRNCIYTGRFNDLLKKLNTYPAWRVIVGSKTPDRRMKDIELVLRFFALFSDLKHYKKPLKGFLNDFMEDHRDLSQEKCEEFKILFRRTADAVVAYLNPRPFHVRKGLNVAVYDSVFTAFARRINEVSPPTAPVPLIEGKVFGVPKPSAERITTMQNRFQELLNDDDYTLWVSRATTDDDVVPKRINKAEEVLFRQ
jgi:hypothetical protein